MPCNCKNCAAGLPDIYCVATRTLSGAEAKRLAEILARRHEMRSDDVCSGTFPRTDQTGETDG